MKKIEENRMTRTSKGIKFFMVLEMEFFQASNPEIVTVPPIVFHSETHEVYEDTNLEEVLQFIYREFTYNIGEYQRNGSGWGVKDLLQLDKPFWNLIHSEQVVMQFFRRKFATKRHASMSKVMINAASCGTLLLEYILLLIDTLIESAITKNMSTNSM